jgi:CBS domain containing-hemolysin-like protein
VVGEDADDIVGVVHVKQAFAIPPDRRAQVPVAELQVDPLRVPESMSVDHLLTLLRSGGFQIAVVTDEYGGTAGLVTLEDLVEELVGDLQDEHDRSRPSLVRDGDDIVFDAALRPDELLERTGVSVPDDDEYDTLGGFITDRLDRFPEIGDEVEIDEGVLRVEQLDGTRVDRLRFQRTPADHDSPDESAEPDSSRRKDRAR